MSEPNLDVLFERVDELNSLINASNKILDLPPSHLAESFGKSISKNSTVIAGQMSKAFSSGKLEKVLIVGGALAVIWVGAKTVDAVSNHVAKSNAKEAIDGYYKELAVKQNLVCEKQMEIIKQVSNEKDELSLKSIALKQQLEQIGDLLKRIESFQKDVSY